MAKVIGFDEHGTPIIESPATDTVSPSNSLSEALADTNKSHPTEAEVMGIESHQSGPIQSELQNVVAQELIREVQVNKVREIQLRQIEAILSRSGMSNQKMNHCMIQIRAILEN